MVTEIYDFTLPFDKAHNRLVTFGLTTHILNVCRFKWNPGRYELRGDFNVRNKEWNEDTGKAVHINKLNRW